MFELQSPPWVQRRSGEKKQQAGAECPAVSMETNVTLQRMLSMLSRLNSEGRNKPKMT